MMQLTIAGGIDVIGKLGYSYLEPRLDGSHHLLVTLGGDERDRQTLGSETTSTTMGVKYVRDHNSVNDDLITYPTR